MQTYRPRRLRNNELIRSLVAETRISKDALIYPYFVVHGKDEKHPIKAMPGIHHFSVDRLVKDVEKGIKYGINKVLLFGVGEEKTEDGSSSYSSKSIVAKAVKELKKQFGSDLYVITDVCVCAYTSHGHCGILENGQVLNDPSVELLSKMALAHAKAGADMVAPSDMMDGRIGAIRQLLDKEGYTNTSIMSYAVKFASAYYGPFREAADSSPASGDRKSYQMDVRNGREALREAWLDEEEGADILMVKPALAFLDVIRGVKEQTTLPLACYNVSGEYSMVKNAAKAGLIDERQVVRENMTAFTRAGADIIITYHARDLVEKGWI
ncbi:MAG: porphobilinogen synthase [Flavobacteriales bacterium]|nr:porphobilinogen synthase [Flavobacteriales bacterium]